MTALSSDPFGEVLNEFGAFLVNNMQMGILVENEYRHIAITNQAFCDLFSIPLAPQSLKGMDCSGSAEQYKSLFADPEHFVSRITRLMAEKNPVKNEELALADGRYFERDYIPIFIGKAYKGNIWTYRDVTERKLSDLAVKLKEEKYRHIIANMNLGLLEVDNEELIQFANGSFCQMSGYEIADLIGKHASALFTRQEHHPIIAGKSELRKKGISDTYEISVLTRTNEQKWWLISGAPLYNDSGELIGSIGIHLDITDQKMLEFELHEARAAAEQSARAKETFLANMSHEIRTPMNAILGMSRQLEKTILNKQQHIYLNTITTATDHLMVVINDILDISKIEAGKMNLERIGFSPTDVVRHILQVMQPKADEKGLELGSSTGPGISPVLIGDPHRLNQVLLNLASNAIKFTEKGGVTISCATVAREGQNQTVRIRVKDTGIGMDEQFLENVFEKFSQEDRTTARKYGGTGLGMSISKQLVELMGGTILVKSVKGSGTEVILTIPFLVGTDADLPEAKNNVINSALLKNQRILLVEDNEMNRMVVTTMMEDYHADITEVTNGEEAVELLRRETFDLVLMDIQMPVMNGFEATEIIRRTLRLDTPIIALTANAIKGERERCLKLGMNDFVSKPFEEQELVKTIASCLQKTPAAQQVPPRQVSPPAALYNLSKLEKISHGSDAFVEKMLQLFVAQVPASVEEMQTAYQAGKMKTVSAIAHKIKPSIDSLEINSVREVVRSLEQMALSDPQSPVIEPMIAQLRSVIDEVKKQFDELLKGIREK